MCMAAIALCQIDPNTKPQSAAQIKSVTIDTSTDGSYLYQYESDNGINIAQSGVGGVAVNGQSSWISKEGVPLTISYTADVNGYRPVGFHLPTPPPIPPAIAKALEYLKTHAPKESDSEDYSYRPSKMIKRPVVQYKQTPTDRKLLADERRLLAVPRVQPTIERKNPIVATTTPAATTTVAASTTTTTTTTTTTVAPTTAILNDEKSTNKFNGPAIDLTKYAADFEESKKIKPATTDSNKSTLKLNLPPELDLSLPLINFRTAETGNSTEEPPTTSASDKAVEAKEEKTTEQVNPVKRRIIVIKKNRKFERLNSDATE